MVAPEIERLAASVRAFDGLPRFVWTDERPEPASYVRTILAAIAERQRWRVQYEPIGLLWTTIRQLVHHRGTSRVSWSL